MTEASRAGERFCVVIPAYCEEKRIADVVRGALKHVKDVLVVDDGSKDRTAEEARGAGAVVVVHEVNKGKGAALNTGFEHARAHGYDAVIVLDGDGQHDPGDIPQFIEAYARTGIPVLIGNRMWDKAHMPLVRRMTNAFMSWLLSEQIGQYVPDTQCGYRLYRLDIIPFVPTEAARFAAESEIILHIASRGLRMDAVPIRAIYRDEKSKINPFKDTFRFFAMLRRFRKKRRGQGWDTGAAGQEEGDAESAR